MPADPNLAGRVISGAPMSVAELANWINTAEHGELRAALHRIADIATGPTPRSAGTLVVAESPAGSDEDSTAYEWYDGSDDDPDDRPGWYDVTGREFGPRNLHEIRYPHGSEQASDDPPPFEREVDGWWAHNSGIITAMCGGVA
jgi:hypothetical protein